MTKVMRFFRSAAASLGVLLRHIGETRMRQRAAEEFSEFYSPARWP
jgi:hypothetical protein